MTGSEWIAVAGIGSGAVVAIASPAVNAYFQGRERQKDRAAVRQERIAQDAQKWRDKAVPALLEARWLVVNFTPAGVQSELRSSDDEDHEEISGRLEREMDEREERWNEASRSVAEVATGHPSNEVRDTFDKVGRAVTRYLNQLHGEVGVALSLGEKQPEFTEANELLKGAQKAVEQATDALHEEPDR